MQCTNASTQWDRIGHPTTNKKQTNRQARHPRRSPTLPRQLRPRPKKAKAKQRETTQATSANEQASQPEPTPNSTHSPSRPWRASGSRARQQAGTGTNKNEQEATKPSKVSKRTKEQGTPKPERPEVTGNKAAASTKAAGVKAGHPQARVARGHREQGSGQPTNQTDGQTDGQTAPKTQGSGGLVPP